MDDKNYIGYKIIKPITREETRQIASALTSFIVRVSDGRNVTEAETSILPEVVRALKELSGVNF